MNATPKQLFALYCATKINTRNLQISLEKASELIGRSKNGEDISQELIELGCKPSEKKVEVKVDFESLYKKACEVAHEAVMKHIPTPMVVSEHENMFDDNSPVKNSYYVADGICGFASIRMKLNTAFGKWMVKNGYAEKSMYGGAYLWVSQYNQSYEKKSKFAYKFCEFMKQNGIDCYAETRLD